MEICNRLSKWEVVIFDIEVFPHWWCVVYNQCGEKRVVTSETKGRTKILKDLRCSRILCGFNIKGYDMRILRMIVEGFTPEQIYRLSKAIIGNDATHPHNTIKFWHEYNFTDLYDDWRFGSLKAFESNSGMSIEESGISFDKECLTEADKQNSIEYCIHDVDATEDMFVYRKNYLEAKITLAEMYDLPILKSLKSSNAKLCAKVLQAEKRVLHKSKDFIIPKKVEPYIKEWVPDEVLNSFRYIDPTLCKDEEEIIYEFDLFENHIKYGVGGVHSVMDKWLYVAETEDYMLVNIDVQSYYPNLLMAFDLMSRCCPDSRIYKSIYEMRLTYKQGASKELSLNGKTPLYYEYMKKSNALKLILNTTYGAMKNKNNALYDPDRATTMCYLGQLLLTALAHELYTKCVGLKVIQLNTDGILVYVPKRLLENMRAVVRGWETLTGLSMEEDKLIAFYQRDVNNYIELTGNPKKPYKLKGKWANQSQKEDMSNLNAPVVHKAVLLYYTEGVPLEQTIHSCTDLIDFCFTTTTGRAYDSTWYEYEGQYIPANKVNRVIATTDKRCGTIRKRKTEIDDEGNVKERYDKASEIPLNCRLCNDDIRQAELPSDLDFEWYVDFAKKRIKEMKELKLYDTKKSEYQP